MVNWRWLYFRKRFHEAIRSGAKTRTLRSHKIPVGALVATPVGLIRIMDVSEPTVRWVGENLWREEGCASSEDFFQEFRDIHPGVELETQFYLHQFELLLPAAEELSVS